MKGVLLRVSDMQDGTSGHDRAVARGIARMWADLRRERLSMAALRCGWSRYRYGPMLLRIGIPIFVVGGVGDVVYHALPVSLALALEPVVGVDADRSHLVTLIGMVGITASVLRRAAAPRR